MRLQMKHILVVALVMTLGSSWFIKAMGPAGKEGSNDYLNAVNVILKKGNLTDADCVNILGLLDKAGEKKPLSSDQARNIGLIRDGINAQRVLIESLGAQQKRIEAMGRGEATIKAQQGQYRNEALRVEKAQVVQSKSALNAELECAVISREIAMLKQEIANSVAALQEAIRLVQGKKQSAEQLIRDGKISQERIDLPAMGQFAALSVEHPQDTVMFVMNHFNTVPNIQNAYSQVFQTRGWVGVKEAAQADLVTFLRIIQFAGALKDNIVTLFTATVPTEQAVFVQGEEDKAKEQQLDKAQADFYDASADLYNQHIVSISNQLADRLKNLDISRDYAVDIPAAENNAMAQFINENPFFDDREIYGPSITPDNSLFKSRMLGKLFLISLQLQDARKFGGIFGSDEQRTTYENDVIYSLMKQLYENTDNPTREQIKDYNAIFDTLYGEVALNVSKTLDTRLKNLNVNRNETEESRSAENSVMELFKTENPKFDLGEIYGELDPAKADSAKISMLRKLFLVSLQLMGTDKFNRVLLDERERSDFDKSISKLRSQLTDDANAPTQLQIAHYNTIFDQLYGAQQLSPNQLSSGARKQFDEIIGLLGLETNDHTIIGLLAVLGNNRNEPALKNAAVKLEGIVTLFRSQQSIDKKKFLEMLDDLNTALQTANIDDRDAAQRVIDVVQSTKQDSIANEDDLQKIAGALGSVITMLRQPRPRSSGISSSSSSTSSSSGNVLSPGVVSSGSSSSSSSSNSSSGMINVSLEKYPRILRINVAGQPKNLDIVFGDLWDDRVNKYSSKIATPAMTSVIGRSRRDALDTLTGLSNQFPVAKETLMNQFQSSYQGSLVRDTIAFMAAIKKTASWSSVQEPLEALLDELLSTNGKTYSAKDNDEYRRRLNDLITQYENSQPRVAESEQPFLGQAAGGNEVEDFSYGLENNSFTLNDVDVNVNGAFDPLWENRLSVVDKLSSPKLKAIFNDDALLKKLDILTGLKASLGSNPPTSLAQVNSGAFFKEHKNQGKLIKASIVLLQQLQEFAKGKSVNTKSVQAAMQTVKNVIAHLVQGPLADNDPRIAQYQQEFEAAGVLVNNGMQGAWLKK